MINKYKEEKTDQLNTLLIRMTLSICDYLFKIIHKLFHCRYSYCSGFLKRITDAEEKGRRRLVRHLLYTPSTANFRVSTPTISSHHAVIVINHQVFLMNQFKCNILRHQSPPLTTLNSKENQPKWIEPIL